MQRVVSAEREMQFPKGRLSTAFAIQISSKLTEIFKHVAGSLN